MSVSYTHLDVYKRQKLDRIERDIEKTRAKILAQQKKLKDLEAQKVEEENAQIVQMVKAAYRAPTGLRST